MSEPKNNENMWGAIIGGVVTIVTSLISNSSKKKKEQKQTEKGWEISAEEIKLSEDIANNHEISMTVWKNFLNLNPNADTTEVINASNAYVLKNIPNSELAKQIAKGGLKGKGLINVYNSELIFIPKSMLNDYKGQYIDLTSSTTKTSVSSVLNSVLSPISNTVSSLFGSSSSTSNSTNTNNSTSSNPFTINPILLVGGTIAGYFIYKKIKK